MSDRDELEVSGGRDGGRPGRRPARCEACSARIDRTTWHPVTTLVDGDGDFHVLTFCTADCRERWRYRSDDVGEP